MKYIIQFSILLCMGACCSCGQQVADSTITTDTTFIRFDPNPALLDEISHLAPKAQSEYLVSQIKTNIKGDNLEFNWRKATAIRLLARSSASNKVEILIENISFMDDKHRNFPAYYAFQEIGEPAVAPLLEFAISSTDYPAVEGAGGTIRAILGPQKYQELLDANKERMSVPTLQLLSTAIE